MSHIKFWNDLTCDHFTEFDWTDNKRWIELLVNEKKTFKPIQRTNFETKLWKVSSSTVFFDVATLWAPKIL